jgi:hypothetical protein
MKTKIRKRYVLELTEKERVKLLNVLAVVGRADPVFVPEDERRHAADLYERLTRGDWI